MPVFKFSLVAPPSDISFLSVVDGQTLFNSRDKTSTPIKQATIRQVGWHPVDIPAEWFLTSQAYETTSRVLRTMQCTIQYLSACLRHSELKLERTMKGARLCASERDGAFEELVELRDTVAILKMNQKAHAAKQETIHIKRKEVASKGLVCTMCDNAYPSTHALQSHYRKRHKQSENYAAMASASAAVNSAVTTEKHRDAVKIEDAAYVGDESRGFFPLRSELCDMRMSLAKLTEQQAEQQRSLSPVNIVGVPAGAYLPSLFQHQQLSPASPPATSEEILHLRETIIKTNERVLDLRQQILEGKIHLAAPALEPRNAPWSSAKQPCQATVQERAPSSSIGPSPATENNTQTTLVSAQGIPTVPLVPEEHQKSSSGVQSARISSASQSFVKEDTSLLERYSKNVSRTPAKIFSTMTLPGLTSQPATVTSTALPSAQPASTPTVPRETPESPSWLQTPPAAGAPSAPLTPSPSLESTHGIRKNIMTVHVDSTAQVGIAREQAFLAPLQPVHPIGQTPNKVPAAKRSVVIPHSPAASHRMRTFLNLESCSSSSSHSGRTPGSRNYPSAAVDRATETSIAEESLSFAQFMEDTARHGGSHSNLTEDAVNVVSPPPTPGSQNLPLSTAVDMNVQPSAARKYQKTLPKLVPVVTPSSATSAPSVTSTLAVGTSIPSHPLPVTMPIVRKTVMTRTTTPAEAPPKISPTQSAVIISSLEGLIPKSSDTPPSSKKLNHASMESTSSFYYTDSSADEEAATSSSSYYDTESEAGGCHQASPEGKLQAAQNVSRPAGQASVRGVESQESSRTLSHEHPSHPEDRSKVKKAKKTGFFTKLFKKK